MKEQPFTTSSLHMHLLPLKDEIHFSAADYVQDVLDLI